MAHKMDVTVVLFVIWVVKVGKGLKKINEIKIKIF